MSQNLGSYILLLVLGTTCTIVVGLILRRIGKSMLEEAYPEERAINITALVTVGYFLFALGVLSVISTIKIPIEGTLQLAVTKLGVVLLILGVAYAVSLMILVRIRNARAEAKLNEDYTQAVRGHNHRRADDVQTPRVIEGN